MRYALICLLVFGATSWAGNQLPVIDSVAFNVNARYTVESVELSNEIESRISRGLRQDLEQLIGQKLNPSALNDLARRIRNELNVRTVSQRVLRGNTPGHVKVVMELAHQRGEFDLSVPTLLYQSAEGFSATVNGTVRVGNNRFTAGLVSDADELVERYTGVRARYENRRLGTDRVRLSFEFDSYHDQWNLSTRNSISGNGTIPALYRSRENFQPLATVLLARPLTLSFGTSFQQLEPESPGTHTQSANAVITNLGYRRRSEGGIVDEKEVEADYSLRAATKALNSDFAYSRHRWALRYSVSRGKHVLSDQAVAGVMTGRAPLFERFVLGDSSMLRGWNKFELDPLGGSRVAHNSLEYRYGMFEVFYDTGAIWDPGQDVVARHSVGAGLRKGSFQIAMAFPLREGRISPTLMVGMNY